jgi:hypothetical protein
MQHHLFVCLIILYKKYICKMEKCICVDIRICIEGIYCEAAASITSSSNQLQGYASWLLNILGF